MFLIARVHCLYPRHIHRDVLKKCLEKLQKRSLIVAISEEWPSQRGGHLRGAAISEGWPSQKGGHLRGVAVSKGWLSQGGGLLRGVAVSGVATSEGWPSQRGSHLRRVVISEWCLLGGVLLCMMLAHIYPAL